MSGLRSEVKISLRTGDKEVDKNGSDKKRTEGCP